MLISPIANNNPQVVVTCQNQDGSAEIQASLYNDRRTNAQDSVVILHATTLKKPLT